MCGLAVVDTGAYLCVCGGGQERTSATLTINGNDVCPIYVLVCMGSLHILLIPNSAPLSVSHIFS